MSHFNHIMRRKMRRWLRDSRYRDQRKYVTFGSVTILFGIVSALIVFEIENWSWIISGTIIFMVTIMYFIWKFLNER